MRGHAVSLLAAKDQAQDTHALQMGLVAGLIFGGLLAVVAGLSGAVDSKYTIKTVIGGMILALLGALVWKTIP